MRSSAPAYVIADDFTGAAALAGEFAALGVRTALYRHDHADDFEADAIVLDTASRYMAGRESHRHTSEVTRRISSSGKHVVIKKVDSRLRGEIAADLRAFFAAYNGRVVIVTASPSAGVRTESGHQLNDAGLDVDLVHLLHDIVDGQPLAVSLAQVAEGPQLIAELIEASRARVVIADATTDQHLQDVVRGADAAGVHAFVGTYGLGQAVARRLGHPVETIVDQVRPTVSRVLIIVGSISEIARAQVRDLIAAGSTEIIVDPIAALRGFENDVRRVSEAVEQSTAEIVVLHTHADLDIRGSGPTNGGLSDTEMANAIAPVLAAGVTAMPTAGVIISGGETAGSVATSLGWNAFDVLDEIAPGVAICRTQNPGQRYVITKPGAFGDACTLTNVARQLLEHDDDPSPARPPTR